MISNIFFIYHIQNEYEIVFEDQIESENINLVYAPILDVTSSAAPYDHVFSNETIRLSVVFLAKPIPDPEEIEWKILNGSLIQIAHPEEVNWIFEILAGNQGIGQNQLSNVVLEMPLRCIID